MEDKLRRHINGLFEDTKPTKKAVELKEEMLQNLEDKYRDLLDEGKTPEAAFNIAVAGIGDVSALLRQLEDDGMLGTENEKYEQARRKSALLTTIAVMMYILSVLPIIIVGEIFGGRHELAIPVFIVMVAAATGILIYNSMTKPKYLKEDDTMVEEFREWQADTQERKQMRGAVSTALWTLILVLYFIFSFTTMMWHISWVIFIIGALVESLINIFFAMQKKGR